MSPVFHCELFYVRSKHLDQIYHGFEQLRKKGIISLSIKRATDNVSTKPLLRAVINGKYNVIYDTLDGLNWIDGSATENLSYFRNEVDADFYFKRSFSNEVQQNSPKNCRVFPLGLNYTFDPEIRMPKTLKETAIDTAYNNALVAKLYKRKFFNAHDFEYYPTLNKEPKILFLTRLHESSDAKSEENKSKRECINEKRIQ